MRKTFPSESTGKALATWVRSLGITEQDVDSNHGWRHTFKTDSRHAEVVEEVISALQGHAIAGMSGRYGEFPARVTSKIFDANRSVLDDPDASILAKSSSCLDGRHPGRPRSDHGQQGAWPVCLSPHTKPARFAIKARRDAPRASRRSPSCGRSP